MPKATEVHLLLKKDTPACYTPKSQPSVLLSIPPFVSLLKSNPNNDYPVLKILSWDYFLAENRPILPTGISLSDQQKVYVNCP